LETLIQHKYNVDEIAAKSHKHILPSAEEDENTAEERWGGGGESKPLRKPLKIPRTAKYRDTDLAAEYARKEIEFRQAEKQRDKKVLQVMESPTVQTPHSTLVDVSQGVETPPPLPSRAGKRKHAEDVKKRLRFEEEPSPPRKQEGHDFQQGSQETRSPSKELQPFPKTPIPP